LEDVNRCIDAAQAQGWDAQRLDALEWHRAEVLIDMQRYDEAEKSLDRIAEANAEWLVEKQPPEWVSSRGYAAQVRNNYAYFCSRADRKLSDAARFIDWAVNDYAALDDNYQLCALVYTELKQNEPAVRLLSKAIAGVETKFKLAQRQVLAAATEAAAYGVPLQGDLAGQLLTKLTEFQHDVAVLRSSLLARAQLYEQLDQQDRADADRKRAAQLGEAPAAKPGTKSVLNLQDIVQHLSTSAAYVDTRGCVRFRQGQYAEALRDFDYALEIQQLEDAINGQNQTGRPFSLIDPREVPFAVKEYQRAKATLLYHRALARRRLNDTRGAELDEQAIRDLGFEPSPTLF
jgi:tetratricopeptide (TPR) repeat protein